MDRRNNVSLCMVVRNEADFLHACLRTATPVVGEVILIDTGSTDETPGIGAGYGAKIYSFAWKNDFSAARNFSLQQATKPWVLVMDADELLSPQDYHKFALLLEASSRGVVDNNSISVAYSLTQRNYLKGSGQITWDQSWAPNSHEYQEGQGYPGYLDVPVVRLFPRLSQIVYSGVVHESVEDSLAQSGFPIESSGLVLHHYGQVRGSERIKQKKILYLELGQEKLRSNPQDPRAHFELGIQLQELGQFNEAIPHFKEAMELDASFSLADLYLGICFSRMGKVEEARAHLSRAQELRTNSPGIYCELGLIDLKQGSLPEAARQFERALAINPDHVGSLCYLGSIRVNQGEILSGIQLLEKAVEIDGNHHDSWMNLGWAFDKCAKPNLAVHCLEKALALKPDDSETAIQLGLVLARSGEPAAAALLLEQAARHRPEDEVLKMWWAAALALSGKELQAQETYQQILAKGGKLCRLAQQQLDRLKNSVPANCA